MLVRVPRTHTCNVSSLRRHIILFIRTQRTSQSQRMQIYSRTCAHTQKSGRHTNTLTRQSKRKSTVNTCRGNTPMLTRKLRPQIQQSDNAKPYCDYIFLQGKLGNKKGSYMQLTCKVWIKVQRKSIGVG